MALLRPSSVSQSSAVFYQVGSALFRKPSCADNHPRWVNPLGNQLLSLVILAIPVAAVSWTITHEEVFREPRDYCKKMSESNPGLWKRKFFYLFTCEYCFSHYVAAGFLLITRFKLLYPGWRGYAIALFALVWLANIYMAIFANLKLDVHHERLEIKSKDMDLQARSTGKRPAA